MQHTGHFINGSRYGTDQLIAYATYDQKHGAIGEAFLDSAITQRYKSLVYGKRVLDIGCGSGEWCYIAAQYGAETVDGLDIQEGMVKLAKQSTSGLDKVRIQLGDATDMPYDDASFDVAISLFVSCNVPPGSFKKYFQELRRVLVPGGKAILLIPTDWSCSRLYTKMEADPAIVENEVAQIAENIPKYPTTTQVSESFKTSNSVLNCCLAVNDKGDVFRVKNISQLTHGQPIWKHTDVMMFPNYFYSDHSSITCILESGLHIDSIENYCTEEKRVAYNNKNPKASLIKKCVKEPTALVYYLSKADNDEPPY